MSNAELNMKELIIEKIKRKRPCRPAMIWLQMQPDDASLEALVHACPDGLWLWWLVQVFDLPAKVPETVYRPVIQRWLHETAPKLLQDSGLNAKVLSNKDFWDAISAGLTELRHAIGLLSFTAANLSGALEALHELRESEDTATQASLVYQAMSALAPLMHPREMQQFTQVLKAELGSQIVTEFAKVLEA